LIHPAALPFRDKCFSKKVPFQYLRLFQYPLFGPRSDSTDVFFPEVACTPRPLLSYSYEVSRFSFRRNPNRFLPPLEFFGCVSSPCLLHDFLQLLPYPVVDRTPVGSSPTPFPFRSDVIPPPPLDGPFPAGTLSAKPIFRSLDPISAPPYSFSWTRLP